MKHTKGPWIVSKKPKVFSIESESKRQIAIMTEHHGDCPKVPMHQFERSEQDKADACLIAAAPEMLEALEELTEVVRRYGGMGADPFKYDKLIAKARGGK